ncbi:CAP domain-containing protein [Williamwhitmania taraxaci]|uniref:Uncharacterized conserved protein YkwD, contains CAP (CSP/antigen 5/PR1) domain n=1 Tax=Williamwhitmania taraxaci TaxID=1640674 RepID=A0A1G6KP62_9BACT|nr:CAP domain-containing protein [Williamwhitmania taraxaci]SDC32611.1 Uncharacterized conserved protein YkwD, contains CAP (CSP/antigen 5/PR1) domain [Williamwhitmania taraxaci]
MRRFLLLICFAVFATACSKDKSDYEYAQMETQVLKLINEHRVGLKLVELKANASIVDQARSHSMRMASGAVAFGHDGFDTRFDALKDKLKASSGAENVAMGYSTPELAVAGWLNSSGHKKNIEGNYTLSGVGIAKSKSGVFYYTQIFIKN